MKTNLLFLVLIILDSLGELQKTQVAARAVFQPLTVAKTKVFFGKFLFLTYITCLHASLFILFIFFPPRLCNKINGNTEQSGLLHNAKPFQRSAGRARKRRRGRRRGLGCSGPSAVEVPETRGLQQDA